MKWLRFCVICTCVLAVGGCATMSNRVKTISLMAGSAVVGGTIGAITCPTGESELAHGALWGGLAAATTGVAGLFIFDEEAKRKEAEEKSAKLEKELAAFRDDIEPEIVASNRVGLSRPLPEKYRHLITPGQWSLYKVDRWATSSDNELVHQDLIFRFYQPQINPSGKAPTTEDGGK